MDVRLLIGLFLSCLFISIQLESVVAQRPFSYYRRTVTVAAAIRYLSTFGYGGPGAQSYVMWRLRDRRQLRRAMARFQHSFGLRATGELDIETQKAMADPRCGFTDNNMIAGTRKRRQIPTSGKWPNSNLRYAITDYDGLSPSRVGRTIAAAFKFWSDVTPLTFTRVGSATSAEIEILFAKRNHGDGEPFDGRGNTLAHAYSPSSRGQRGTRHGDAHFDNDENWVFSRGLGGGVHLLEVATHELGHSLGLGHSSSQDSIMYPRYQNARTVELRDIDVTTIRQLYPGPIEATRAPTRTTPTLPPPTRPPPTLPPSTRPPLTSGSTVPFTRASLSTQRVTRGRPQTTLRGPFTRGTRIRTVPNVGTRSGPTRAIPTTTFSKRPVPTRPVPTRPVPTRPVPTRPVPSPTRVPGPRVTFCNNPLVDAVVTDRTMGKTFVFIGNDVLSVRDRRVERQQRISDVFRNTRRVDAGFIYNNFIILFTGSMVDIYWGTNTQFLTSRPIRDVFGNVPDNVDAAFEWLDGKQYIFKGDQYWQLTRFNAIVDTGPSTVDQWRFPRARSSFGKIRAITTDSQFRTYVFYGSNAYLYNSFARQLSTREPLPVASNWLGCP